MTVHKVKIGLVECFVTTTKRGKVTWYASGTYEDPEYGDEYASVTGRSERSAIAHWREIIERRLRA